MVALGSSNYNENTTDHMSRSEVILMYGVSYRMANVLVSIRCNTA